MTAPRSLLVELFVEELPPKALKALGHAFADALAASLRSQGLATDHSATTAFASPRRLAAHISAVRSQAEDRPQTHKLMPVAVGLDADGRPTPALLKKLAGLGADATVVAGLQRSGQGKAESLLLETVARGAMLATGLQKALDEAIAGLPIPKVMRYQLESGEGADFQPGWTSVDFVRPAHGLVALHGADLVPVRALGLAARRETHGHRFEAPINPVMLQDADHYARQLEEQGAVIASFDARHGEIARQLRAAAAREGLRLVDDPALLDEVTALVERPNVLVCEFDAAFLAVPPECLVLTMKANQKYFPLLEAGGEARLTNRFLVVSNIRPDDPSRVIEGNERVVRPRLADAKFFYDQDRKRSLASRVDGLAKVVYHGQLGSQRDRVERVRAIAAAIARQCGVDEALAAAVDRAALLAKADLLTDMVGEFPELQGVMGGYYARHDGESDAVALAIEDHYKPRFAGDALPRGEVGQVVALADKLETLVGLFGIGQAPTGDKDPFALRRHALGVVRMLSETALPLALDALLAAAVPPFGERIADPTEALGRFIYERLAGSLRDRYGTQEIDAVLSLRPQRLADIAPRLAALRSFAALPEAAPLAAANKRVGNILKKSQREAVVDSALFAEPAERALHAALASVVPPADAAFAAGDYTGSLRALAALREPVDTFFDEVMVNAEDAALRRNRLALLGTLHAAMNRVADLSKLSSAGADA